MKFKPPFQISFSPSISICLHPHSQPLKSIGHPLLGLFPDPQKLNYLSPHNTYYMYTWSQICSLTHNTSIAELRNSVSFKGLYSKQSSTQQWHHFPYIMVSFTTTITESGALWYILMSQTFMWDAFSHWPATTSHKQPKKTNTKISPTESLQLESLVNDPLS